MKLNSTVVSIGFPLIVSLAIAFEAKEYINRQLFFYKKSSPVEIVKIKKTVIFEDFLYNEEKDNFYIYLRDKETNEIITKEFPYSCNFNGKIGKEFIITEECDFVNDKLVKCEYYDLPIYLCY